MKQVVTLDVRPILAAGHEPFASIMQATAALKPGEILRLVAPFRPVPLLLVMRRQGFTSRVTQLDGGLWQVDFSPSSGALSAGSSLDAADWPAPTRLLDLTGREPSDLVDDVLAAVEAVPPGEVIFALMYGEPVDLLSHLTSHGHSWVGNHAVNASGYRLR